MAALTGNYETAQKAGALVAFNVGANRQIFAGALVALDDATGYLEPASDAAGKSFCGVSLEPGDNTGGTAGDVGVRVQKTGSFAYDFAGGTPSQAIIGKRVYAVDDHTVAAAATTNSDVLVGTVVGLVGAARVRVRIDGAVG